MNTGAGAAGSGIGTVFDIAQNILSNNSVNSAIADEIKRQQGYQQQASNVFYPWLGQQGAGQAGQQIAQGSQDRQAGYNRLYNQPLMAGQHFDPQTMAALQLSGQLRGNLGGYQDYLSNQRLGAMGLEDQLSPIAFNAGVDAYANPFKIYSAQHSHDYLGTLGQLANTAGGLAMLA